MGELAISVKITTLPADETVEVPGLGAFKNGSVTPLDPEQIAQFEAEYGSLRGRHFPPGVKVGNMPKKAQPKTLEGGN